MDSGLKCECFVVSLLFLALYLLDLCSFAFSLVQCLYVWNVVKRTHGVLPCTLVSNHPAHAIIYRFSKHMQSFCTCVPVAGSLFAWLVLISVLFRINRMNVYGVCFHAAISWSAAPTPWTFKNLFGAMDSGLKCECFVVSLLFLALYLLDLCSFAFSLVQCLSTSSSGAATTSAYSSTP